MPGPTLRPPLCFADSVALLATASLMVVVSTPVGVQLGAVDIPTDLDAYQRVADTLPAPPPEDTSPRGTWVQFVPTPPPVEAVELPEAAPKGHTGRRLRRKNRRIERTAPTGSTIVEAPSGTARLTLHKPDDRGLTRYRASLPALRRLAHRPTVTLPAGPRSAADEPIARVPLDPGRQSWQASRDLVLAGHLPHPDLVRTESFVAAVAPDHTLASTETVHADAIFARDPTDAYTVWVQVTATAPNPVQRTGPPLDLVLLVDTSGSMGVTGGLDEVRAAVLRCARTLRADDRLTVLAFDGTHSEVLPATRDIDVQHLATTLDHLEAGGATDAAAGLHAALDALQLRRARRGKSNPQIVLFTDGDVMATGQEPWQAAARTVQDAGVGLTTVGIGQAWAEAAPLESRLARLGGRHLSARDGLEATDLLQEHLFQPEVAPATPTRLSIVFDPRMVDTYEVVGWTGDGPGRTDGALVPTVDLTPGSRASAVLKVRLHRVENAYRNATLGQLRLDVGTEDAPIRSPLQLPASGASPLDRQPALAMAAGAADLADALQSGDPARLQQVSHDLSQRVRPGHPEDAVLLRVARKSANLAALPVLVPGDDTNLDPRLADLMATLSDDCFSDLRDRRGERHGRITARARYLRGRFAGATILDDPLDDRMLEACVVQRLRTWDPPADLEGDLVLPLVWSPRVDKDLARAPH